MRTRRGPSVSADGRAALAGLLSSLGELSEKFGMRDFSEQFCALVARPHKVCNPIPLLPISPCPFRYCHVARTVPA